MRDSAQRPDHWQQFRRLMRWTGIAALAAIALAIGTLAASDAPIRPPMLIAVALAIGLSFLLAGALMGLMFVSARSGHDADAATPPQTD